MARMVVALMAFLTEYEGKEVQVHVGDILAADHDLVRRTPEDYWKPFKAKFEVEQATAAPGEKRAARVKASDAAAE